MSRRENWVRLPKERAAVWSKLDLFEQLIAMQMLANLDCYDGPVEGDIDAHVVLAMRGTVRGHSRQRFRKAIQTIRDAGLFFEHEGKVYLLYDERTWREYRHLAPTAAPASQPAVASQPVPKKVRTKAPAAANDNAGRTRSAREVHAKCAGENQLSLGNHSTDIPRERERVNQRSSISGGAPPAAAPSGVICIEEERAKRAPAAEAQPSVRKKRSRKTTPLDAARAEALELFNQHYAPRHGGTRSWVGYNLLTPLVSCFLREDGTLHREEFERRTIAFLDDPRWSAPGERGHGLAVFTWKHDKYAAHRPAAVNHTPRNPRNYA